MALKDLLLSSLPQYCEILPSETKICFRPMVVSEEKALILAKNTSDRLGLLKTLESIILNCCQDLKKNDFKKIKITDLEYLFLCIRAKSIGEVEGFSLKCPHTNENINLKIDIVKDAKVTKSTANTKIKLTDNLLLIMSEPTIENLIIAPEYDSDEESFYAFIGSCIKQIQTRSEIKDCKQVSFDEVIDFVKNLTNEQMKKVLNYFDNITKLEINKQYKTSDDIERSISIKGIFNYLNFFFEHLNIQSLYKQLFQLKYYHNYELSEIENMIPWEKTVYIEQIKEHLDEEKNLKASIAEGMMYGR
jgi:hypothetical protein